MKRILIGLLAFFALNIVFEMVPMAFAPVRQDVQVCWAIGPDAVVPAYRPEYREETKTADQKQACLFFLIAILLFLFSFGMARLSNYCEKKNVNFLDQFTVDCLGVGCLFFAALFVFFGIIFYFF